MAAARRATGTNLFAMGLESGEAPELWNTDAPDKVRALYDGFIGAGSDLILTNSFGGNRYRLELHHAQDRVYELAKAAAVLARQQVDAGRPIGDRRGIDRADGRSVRADGSADPTIWRSRPSRSRCAR